MPGQATSPNLSVSRMKNLISALFCLIGLASVALAANTHGQVRFVAPFQVFIASSSYSTFVNSIKTDLRGLSYPSIEPLLELLNNEFLNGLVPNKTPLSPKVEGFKDLKVSMDVDGCDGEPMQTALKFTSDPFEFSLSYYADEESKFYFSANRQDVSGCDVYRTFDATSGQFV